MDKTNLEYCRICENCKLPINDMFINHCPRCNYPLKPLSSTCSSCPSKNLCKININFNNKNYTEK